MAELFGFKITRSGQDGGSDGFTAPALMTALLI
jgi:hypothetical protein